MKLFGKAEGAVVSDLIIEARAHEADARSIVTQLRVEFDAALAPGAPHSPRLESLPLEISLAERRSAEAVSVHVALEIAALDAEIKRKRVAFDLAQAAFLDAQRTFEAARLAHNTLIAASLRLASKQQEARGNISFWANAAADPEALHKWPRQRQESLVSKARAAQMQAVFEG